MTRSRSRSRSRTRSRSDRYRNRRSRSHSPIQHTSPHSPPLLNNSQHYAHPPQQARHRINPNPCRCLGVFGLSFHTSERALFRVFDKYGRVERIKLVTDARTNRSRGFAFVYFERVDEAIEAKEQLHGSELDGSAIRVEFSISNREHNPTPGVYMGAPRRNYGGYGYDRYFEDYYGDYYYQRPPPSTRSRSRSRSRSYERSD